MKNNTEYTVGNSIIVYKSERIYWCVRIPNHFRIGQLSQTFIGMMLLYLGGNCNEITFKSLPWSLAGGSYEPSQPTYIKLILTLGSLYG
jgi:hypothetical protein